MHLIAKLAVATQLFLCSTFTLSAQSVAEKIRAAESDLAKAEQQRTAVLNRIEDLKLQRIREDLLSTGLPAVQSGEQLVQHSAYVLDYAPRFMQARWVAHVITPDVISGIVFRTNDFREDSLVKGGSAQEADYFLKTLKNDGSFNYDAFGYDRGHLAPSADFRWSQKALSESYLYSNMSPQLADFNRGAWGDLEDAVRGYIYRHPASQLYVVTGPVLREGLPVINRGKNKVTIPDTYWKVIYDPANNRSIGFIMPNRNITESLQSFAVPVDKVESVTGLDFFNKVPSNLQEASEKTFNAEDWLTVTGSTDIQPMAQETLPKNHFNTEVAKQYTKSNTVINVCGTVVGARLSRAGNILINLDRAFPNQVFTVFIKKENIPNFSYKPEDVLKGKMICVKGRVIDQGGTVTMYVDTERDLQVK